MGSTLLTRVITFSWLQWRSKVKTTSRSTQSGELLWISSHGSSRRLMICLSTLGTFDASTKQLDHHITRWLYLKIGIHLLGRLTLRIILTERIKLLVWRVLSISIICSLHPPRLPIRTHNFKLFLKNSLIC